MRKIFKSFSNILHNFLFAEELCPAITKFFTTIIQWALIQSYPEVNDYFIHIFRKIYSAQKHCQIWVVNKTKLIFVLNPRSKSPVLLVTCYWLVFSIHFKTVIINISMTQISCTDIKSVGLSIADFYLKLSCFRQTDKNWFLCTM